MSTYEEENKELWAWYKKLSDEKYAQIYKETDRYRQVLLEHEHVQDTEEFNKRLDALKAKYNRGIPDEQAV